MVTAGGVGEAPLAPNKVVQWAVDTRKLWPEASRTIQLTQHAKRALAILPQSERDDVLRYVHVRDAKMALVSRLLKRYLISRYAPSPWHLSTPVRNKDTKPIFLLGADEPLAFNVSHQAGLVVLCAVLGPLDAEPAVGVDVVCPSERGDRDRRMVREDGYAGFVGIHDSVFCPREVEALAAAFPYGGPASAVDTSLRYFYTLWCLREAYVKMTGEALLAPWLGVLEMRDFAPPEDMDKPGKELSIWFEGRRVENVDMHVVDLLDDFMVCTSVRRDKEGRTLDVGEWQLFDIEEAISYGEEHADG